MSRHLRSREPFHKRKQPAADDYRRVIRDAERHLDAIRRRHAELQAREIRDETAIKNLETAIGQVESRVAEWRAALARLLEAKAKSTARTRDGRLARADAKRQRKEERRRREHVSPTQSATRTQPSEVSA